MRILNNQSGAMLLNAMVGMTVTIAASVAWMQFMSTAAKDEARLKAKLARLRMENQMLDYLKNSDVSATNAFGAFYDQNLNADTERTSTYNLVTGKRIFRFGGGSYTLGRNLLEAGKVYENGKIFVEKIDYKLTELSPYGGNPRQTHFNRKGLLEVVAKFQYCSNGGSIYHYNESNEVISPNLCPGEPITVERSVLKHVAFKTRADGRIEEVDVKWKNPNNGALEYVGRKPAMAVSDTEEGLLDAANDYTDLKNCFTVAKMYALSGVTAETDCGIQVTSQLVEKLYSEPGSYDLPIETGSIHDFQIEMRGAGGGGGKGVDVVGTGCGSGEGGKAGRLFEQSYPLLSSTNCTFTVGAGGAGSNNRDNPGSAGSSSSFRCGLEYRTAPGGGGGRSCHFRPTLRDGTYSECGSPGQSAVSNWDHSLNGYGSKANCKERHNFGPDANLGAGGGGGAHVGNFVSEDEQKKPGRPGGNGYVKVKFRMCSFYDPGGVLGQLGLTADDLACTDSSNPNPPTCTPVNGTWGAPVPLGTCVGGQQSAQRTCATSRNECGTGCSTGDVQYILIPCGGSSSGGSSSGGSSSGGSSSGGSSSGGSSSGGSSSGGSSSGGSSSGGSSSGGSSSGGGGCFIPGTLITMANGEAKKIEEVQLEDELLDGSLNPVVVKELMEIPYEGEIYGLNGREPFFTPNHPFLSLEGWKSLDPEMSAKESGIPVSMLKAGDILVKEDGLEMVYSLTSRAYSGFVYNFNVSDTSEYIAGGYVVHNKDECEGCRGDEEVPRDSN